jgi:hypothetical protein
MSHLLTAAAINQSGVNLAIAGDLAMQSGNFIGIDGTGGYVTFDSSSHFVGIGSGSTGVSSHLKFTSDGTSGASSRILDSNGNNLLEFAAATVSPIDYLKLTPGTASTRSSLVAVSSATDAGIEISPKGAGQLVLQTPSNASTGIAFSAGSSGTDFYTLRGPQSGLQNIDASITFPDIVTAALPASGDVLKVTTASAGTANPVLEFAADAGAMTYNDINSVDFTALSVLVVSTIYAINNITGSLTAALPAGSDGARIKIIDANGGLTGSITVTLTANGSETINGSTLVLDGAYQAVEIQFNATVGIWNIV